MRFFVKSMGCKTNQLEGQIIAASLAAAGFEAVSNAADADIFVLNSCSVTQRSDKEVLFLLRQAKRENPNVKTVLTGCFAQVMQKDAAQKMPLEAAKFADVVIGNDEKLEIASFLQEGGVKDIFSVKEFHNKFVYDLSTTRANLKIQDGCNNRCSYCIIPYARGNSRSNSIKNIKEQIKILADKGFKEFVLTGIHIGQWGLDFEKPLELVNLIEEIEDTFLVRYRLGSLAPDEITPRLVDVLKKSTKFCPHFHLSLQSGNNEVLKVMNRHYSVESYLDLIKELNSVFNYPFLGSDLIVGFPGESLHYFENTCRNLESSGLSKIHVFPYSERKGTLAAEMEGSVRYEERINRSRILNKISARLHEKFIENNFGRTEEVLVEKKPAKNGLCKGLTRNYIEVLCPNLSPFEHENELVQIELSRENVIQTKF